MKPQNHLQVKNRGVSLKGGLERSKTLIQAIKLADGNTTVELDTDTGELTERGKSFPVLHRPVEDSIALLRLLSENRQAIETASEQKKDKHTVV